MIIGGTILLTFFLPQPLPGWPIWGWPALGGIALVAIVISSITDAETNTKMQLELFQEQFNPRKLMDPMLRQEVEEALEYQRSIQTHSAKQRSGLLKDRLEDTTRQIEEWVGNIYKLALHLDAYRHDPLLAQERESVPRELESLTSRRHDEEDLSLIHISEPTRPY